MSLADIAALAGVQRPVVSMWRKRPRARGEDIPFPAPVATAAGTERFATREVVAWLARSGRGVNPEFRDDALAHSHFPDGGPDPDSAIRGASALAALKARTGRQLTASAPDDLLDQADELDPDDLSLYAEIASLGPDLPQIAGFVDGLADAAYDVAGASRRIDDLWRARRGRTGDLATEALDVAGALAAALALDLAADSVVLADPDGLAEPLIARAVTHLSERIAVSAATGGGSDQARWSRRRLQAAGIDLAPPEPTRQVPVIGILNVVAHGGSAADLLARIEDAHLEFTASQPLIVIGPASALCDPLAEGDAARLREEAFVRGGLRVALRLPAGLRPDSPRLRLALWVLTAAQEQVPIGERWFGAGDLGDRALTPDVIEAVVTDAVACVSGRGARARAFATLRLMRTADVLAEGSALVPIGLGARTPALANPSARVLRLRADQARLRTESLDPTIGGIRIDPLDDDPIDPCSLGHLVEGGDIRLIRGARIATDRLRPDGVVRVFTAADVSARRRAPALGLGALEVATDHPRAQRTEPGDVVFTTSPPAAVVDLEGGAAVCSPVRMLRIQPSSGISPHAVAALVNGLDTSQSDWRAWQIPRSTPQAAAQLDHVLRALEDERRATENRARRLAEFGWELAAAQGLVHISTTERPLAMRRNVTDSVTMSQMERSS